MGRLNVIWRRPAYLEVRRAVADREETESAQTLAASGSYEDALLAYCLAVHELGAGRGDRGELTRLAETLLQDHGVGWRRSKLACMRADLHRALSDRHHAEGTPFQAAWHALVAHGLDPGAALDDRRLAAGVACFTRLERTAALDELSRLRLAGRVLDARAAVADSSDENELDASWCLACCDTTLGGRPDPLADWLVRHPDHLPRHEVVARLYALALPKRQELAVATPAADEHPFVRALTAATDKEVPLDARVAALGAAIDELKQCGDAEIVALGLGAAARSLYGVRRYAFARLVQAALEALSRVLSDGASSDVFRTNLDISESIAVPERWVGGWRRGPETALLLARMSASLGVARVRQLFRSGARAKRLRDQERSELGRILAAYAGTMKGPLMKGAQHLAYLGLSFDEPVERLLLELCDASAAMPFERVIEVVRTELRTGVDQVFEQIDETPIGTGSIGQVHRAVLRGGEEVALKVQYPGIREAIDHDIRALRRITPVLHILVPRTPWRDVLDEVHEQLLGELDFRSEAAMQERFAGAFADHPTLRIPRTWPDLTTERLLVMELAQGSRLVQFAREAPSEQRRSATEALYAFFLAPNDTQGLYADFNPGNFLFDDDEVWCLDFGCIKTWPSQEHVLIRRFTNAAITRDREAFRAVARAMDVTSDPDHFDFDQLLWQFDPESCRRYEDGRPLPFEPQDAARILGNFVRLRSDQTLRPFHLYGARAYFSFLAMIVRLGHADDGMEIARSIIEAGQDGSQAGTTSVTAR